MQNHKALTGHQLKLRRVDARVKGQDLARAMGITPTRISTIERSENLEPLTIQRYLDALLTCGTVGTSGRHVA